MKKWRRGKTYRWKRPVSGTEHVTFRICFVDIYGNAWIKNPDSNAKSLFSPLHKDLVFYATLAGKDKPWWKRLW